MKNFILKKVKNFKETILAWNYMRGCTIIEKGGKRKVLSREYMIKDLLSFDCYNLKELKRMNLPDLMDLYTGVSTGGTEIYDKETGKCYYCGIAS